MPWVSEEQLRTHIINSIIVEKGNLNGFNPSMLNELMSSYVKRLIKTCGHCPSDSTCECVLFGLDYHYQPPMYQYEIKSE